METKEMKYSDIKHIGNYPERQEFNVAEKVFAEKWIEVNTRKSWLNHGLATLEGLLQSSGVSDVWPDQTKSCRFEPISQRDAFVAATVIQWLGSNVGGAFLFECEKAIRVAREKEQEEFHRKHNLYNASLD